MLLLSLLIGRNAYAQKPFTEGRVVYNVMLESPEHKKISGTYTFIFKAAQMRKELKLNNGYEEVVLINTNPSSIYSLQNRNGVKYAIQLNINDLLKRQERYNGFTVNNEQADNRNISGYAVYKGRISYKDGSAADICYAKDWYPSMPVTFERFPDARFMPLSYSYKDENGMTMQFNAEQVTAGPVENSVFRIPPDYKVISNEEYRQMTR